METLKKSSANYTENSFDVSDPTTIAKLYAIMDAIADRVEMHKNIGEQRNNWNIMLLTSINTVVLVAATLVGVAATSAIGAPLLALKLSSCFMYLAATGMLMVMNKIQPSQLVEEQRNATRLFKKLHANIRTCIAIGKPTVYDVHEAMENVVAIEKAFPLPLIGAMLDKFPAAVKPAVWWPQRKCRQETRVVNVGEGNNGNGWSGELEEEMREVVEILRRNDMADYLRLGAKALKINKVLAACGPLLTCLGAVGSVFVGCTSCNNIGAWGVVLGVGGGALASVVNALEHGGQMGMVVELYRSNAGYFKEMAEVISCNLEDEDVERRENGEVFEMKVALNLGRSVSELRDLASSSLIMGKDIKEFGSKLF